MSYAAHIISTQKNVLLADFRESRTHDISPVHFNQKYRIQNNGGKVQTGKPLFVRNLFTAY